MSDEACDPSSETVSAARTIVKSVAYLEPTLDLAKRAQNVDERDLALSRCVNIVRNIDNVEDETYGLIRYDASERRCVLANHVLHASVVARGIIEHIDLVGECWLTSAEAEKSIGWLRGSMLTLSRKLPTIAEVPPVDDEQWGPKWLWPTPAMLDDLRTRLEQLSRAIASYEKTLVGKAIKTIVAPGSYEQIVFLELLRRIGRVASWDSGDGYFSDGPDPLTIMWEGWLEHSFDVVGWDHLAPAVFWEVVDNLRGMGIPFDADCCNIGLVFDDCCFKQPRRRHDIDSLELATEPPTDIANISPDATFATLNDKSGPIIARSIRDGSETSLECLFESYAIEIGMMMDLTAAHLTPDRRWLRLDLSRCRQYAAASDVVPTDGYYPDEFLRSDPFQAAVDLEGLTGVKLANNGDPVWLLMQHKRFKEATTTFGEHSSFADYLKRNHLERLFDPDDPDGAKNRERKQREYDLFALEMEEGLANETMADNANLSKNAGAVKNEKKDTVAAKIRVRTSIADADYIASAMGQRDKWIYEKIKNGATNPQVIADLKKIFADRNWVWVSTSNSVSEAVKRWIDDGLGEPLPKRKGGRPRK